MSNKNPQNPICGECQNCHSQRYNKFVTEQGKTYTEFPINCSLIPENNQYLPQYVIKQLNAKELAEAETYLDPVKWAEKFLLMSDGRPWKARWYQEEMLRCSSNRKVVRAGRRIGKTDTIAVDILHFTFTNKSKKVLIVAPYKSQVEEIFGRLRAFISNKATLQNAIKKDVSSPYYQIELYNGSTIRGFTSGTKSGSDAGAVRGQDADRIYLDEADYLQQGDLNATQAILLTTPETRLWASSTPTGRRDHFYKWCKETPTYKQFHFPSMVLPHWEEIEEEIRADIPTDLAWTHEILADFGEQGEGVYQNAYVDSARTNYHYGEMKREQYGWIYSIGVDWNSEVGTEIIVVGYNIQEDMFYVVEDSNVPKQGWTQLAGIEKVIELNTKWIPHFLYVDEGAGATNIELLKKCGYDMIQEKPNHPTCFLKDRVKGYNFSSKIDSRCPITKKVIKKHAKPYLVENSVRRFEEQRFRFSKHDTMLERQLLNYIVERVTPSGVPVYGQNEPTLGDHKVDALNLALIGYKLELSTLGKPVHSSHIGFAGQFGNALVKKQNKSLLPGQVQVQYDKEYEEYKKAQNQLKNKPMQRTDQYGNITSTGRIFSTGRGPVPTTRPGWDSDTEYKHNRPTTTVKRKGKPKRRNI
jgi:replicative DNA helicase